jgi:hypothetical protein
MAETRNISANTLELDAMKACGRNAEYSGVGAIKERIGLLVVAVVFLCLCIPAGKFCTTTVNPIAEVRYGNMNLHLC